MSDPTPDFDRRAYCVDLDEYRLTDAELRTLAESPGRSLRPLARELLHLRATHEQLKRSTQEDYVNIAAKQDRDALKLAKVCRDYRDLHISCEQRVMERNDALARVAALEAAPAQILARLDLHRGTSTRKDSTDEYENPVRAGFDRGLTEALALLGVDAKENFDA